MNGIVFITLPHLLPELAHQELGVADIPPNPAGAPTGRYTLLESYCAEKGCDCRKVMVNFVRVDEPGVIYATIGYGWDTVAYYTEWFHGDEDLAREFAGAYLEMGGRQSPYSVFFLAYFRELASDPSLVDQFKRHYTQWRSVREAYPLNGPCICGNDREYRACCSLTSEAD